jgi:hypothetical protein
VHAFELFVFSPSFVFPSVVKPAVVFRMFSSPSFLLVDGYFCGRRNSGAGLRFAVGGIKWSDLGG